MEWQGWKFICRHLKHDTRRLGLFVKLPHDLSDYSRAFAERWVGDKVRGVVLDTSLFLFHERSNKVKLSA